MSFFKLRKVSVIAIMSLCTIFCQFSSNLSWNIPITHALVELMVFSTFLWSSLCFLLLCFADCMFPYWTKFRLTNSFLPVKCVKGLITDFSFHLLYFLNINFLFGPFFLKIKRVFSSTFLRIDAMSCLIPFFLLFCMSHLVLWTYLELAWNKCIPKSTLRLLKKSSYWLFFRSYVLQITLAYFVLFLLFVHFLWSLNV